MPCANIYVRKKITHICRCVHLDAGKNRVAFRTRGVDGIPSKQTQHKFNRYTLLRHKYQHVSKTPRNAQSWLATALIDLLEVRAGVLCAWRLSVYVGVQSRCTGNMDEGNMVEAFVDVMLFKISPARHRRYIHGDLCPGMIHRRMQVSRGLCGTKYRQNGQYVWCYC